MSELLHSAEQSILTRRLIRPGQRVLVAVSGGIDSMVLLHILHELARQHEWHLTVAHFNHHLRGRSSDADERLVRHTARRLRLPLAVEAAEVRALAWAQRLSVEMAARKLRHEFLARTARRRHIPLIALAHHADDQLELFFLRLLRGSGGEGLAGMKWRALSPSDPRLELVRPLLDQPKAALYDYAVAHAIRHREDASNALLDFQRNRIRHELLPLLRRKYQPALDRTIARVREIVGAEAEFVAQAANKWLSSARKPEARAFDALPVALQRQCLRAQLLELGIEPDYELVEQLRLTPGRPVSLSLAQGRTVATAEGGGTPVLRYVLRDRAGRLQLPAAPLEGFNLSSTELSLEGRAGEMEFDGVRVAWRLSARGSALPGQAGRQRELFDADKVGSPVRLRHWQPGDRFQPIGMARSLKLQDFFTNQKVPRARRRQLLVAATAAGEIFWVEGARISERFKLTPKTNRCLQWRWKRL